MNNKKDIIIFEGEKGSVTLNADFENDTIWATQEQIVSVFGLDQSVVSRHISKIFNDDEVDKESNMHTVHIANSDKPVKVYSLDVILAVGFRAKNTKRVIEFRKWATSVLKQHLIQGYTINTKRLDELNKVVEILGRSENDTIAGVSDILQTYTAGLTSLDEYDHQKLSKPNGTQGD